MAAHIQRAAEPSVLIFGNGEIPAVEVFVSIAKSVNNRRRFVVFADICFLHRIAAKELHCGSLLRQTGDGKKKNSGDRFKHLKSAPRLRKVQVRSASPTRGGARESAAKGRCPGIVRGRGRRRQRRFVQK